MTPSQLPSAGFGRRWFRPNWCTKQCSCEELRFFSTRTNGKAPWLPAAKLWHQHCWSVCCCWHTQKNLSEHMWLNIIWHLGYQEMTSLNLIQWSVIPLPGGILRLFQVSSKPPRRRMWQSPGLCGLPSWLMCLYKYSFRPFYSICAGKSCVNDFFSLWSTFLFSVKEGLMFLPILRNCLLRTSRWVVIISQTRTLCPRRVWSNLPKTILSHYKILDYGYYGD